jgi:hypothetical protein
MRPDQNGLPANRLEKRDGVSEATGGTTLAGSACPVTACNARRGRRGGKTLSKLLGIFTRRPELSSLHTRLGKGVGMGEATGGATPACSAHPVTAGNARRGSRKGDMLLGFLGGRPVQSRFLAIRTA